MSHPIPQPKGLPLLGNVLDVKPGNTWTSLKTLAEQHGEIFQLKVLGKTIVFVASVALADELCDQRRFRKYVGGPVVEIRAAAHDSLFTAYHDEPSWGVAHRIIAPRLGPDAVARMHVEMRDTAQEMLDGWKKQLAATGNGDGHNKSQQGTVISPFDQLARLDLETITLAFYGMRLHGLTGPRHPMLQAMEDATAEAVMRPTRPALVNSLLYGRKFRQAIKTMRGWAAEVVQHRRDNPPAPTTDDYHRDHLETDRRQDHRHDLLAALMTTKDPETGRTLTDTEVIDEIVTMPIGSSTAPCLLTMAIYLLQQHPEVTARARAELDAVVGAADSTPIEHHHVARLEYLAGVVRESLRLSFAAPGFNIEPVPSLERQPVLLARGKYQVAHDQPMIIVMAGVNRDPAVFEDPLAFRPERMVGDAFAGLPDGAKKWFGNGKRECVGRAYAWHWCVLVLAMMLREVDFEDVGKYALERDGWFNYRPVGFQVRVKPRGGRGDGEERR